MKMLFVSLTVAVVAYALLAGPAQAQTPATTPEATTTPEPIPTFTFPTGSISGRIVVQGQPERTQGFSLLVVPTSAPQPLDNFGIFKFTVSTDASGNFTAYELRNGEYLIVPQVQGASILTSLPDSVTYQNPETDEISSMPAFRVTVANGEAVTGIEIVVVFPTPQPIIDDFGEAPAAGLPRTGVGGDTSGSVGAYLGAGVAAAAVLVLASGVAWRVRGGRWRR